MKAACFHGPMDISIDDLPGPRLHRRAVAVRRLVRDMPPGVIARGFYG